MTVVVKLEIAGHIVKTVRMVYPTRATHQGHRDRGGEAGRGLTSVA